MCSNAGTLTVDFPEPRMVRNKFRCLLATGPVMPAWTMKTRRVRSQTWGLRANTRAVGEAKVPLGRSGRLSLWVLPAQLPEAELLGGFSRH